MTGWSGDGAPGSGSLHEFAIGAVTQHFTKRLNRVAGTDFILPTDPQLDAMEAFQLSLGRDSDFNLSTITFNDAGVDTGKTIFLNGTGNPLAGGRCAGCHGNAGALAATLQNLNLNTNVEDVVHPARRIQNFPIDGGFGRTPANQDGSFGNRAFNVASVVEAADTPPFFHNNVVSTLEGVVDFYTGPEFSNPRAAAARFIFNQTQKDQLADFMRAVNTLQNIDVARRELQEILDNRGNPLNEQVTRLQSALEDTQDAIDVLTPGGLFPVLTPGGLFPVAVDHLKAARDEILEALGDAASGSRRLHVQRAIARLQSARDNVAN
jgi:hypothetical protein